MKCIRCGGCCESSLCEPAKDLYGHRVDFGTPCPGLRYEDGLAVCGPYYDGDLKQKNWIQTEVGIGFGCTGAARKEK